MDATHRRGLHCVGRDGNIHIDEGGGGQRWERLPLLGTVLLGDIGWEPILLVALSHECKSKRRRVKEQGKWEVWSDAIDSPTQARKNKQETLLQTFPPAWVRIFAGFR
mgnify:CR=1 FL=1